MARVKHAVVRLDNITGMVDGARIHSGRFYSDVANKVTADIDNGFPVKIGALEDGEREIRICEAPAQGDTDWGIVTTPEVDSAWDRNYLGIQDFYNRAGEAIRVHVLKDHNTFSVSAEALDGTPTVGQKIDLGGTNGKWHVGSTGIATCIAIDTIGTAVAVGSVPGVAPVTLYAFEIDPA